MSRSFWFHLIAVVLLTNVAVADNWPQWRGVKQDGMCAEKGIATAWSKEQHIAWSTPLPGPAGATPVVWGDRIYLTSVDGDNLVLMCVSTAGQELWKQVVGAGNKDARAGEGNSASPSPCTDGEHVWCFFGTGVLGCYDIKGNQVWKFDVPSRYGKFDIQFGMTATPVLHGDHLYLQLIHGTWGAPYRVGKIIKLDKKTGDEVWAVDRETEADDECKHSYASPVMYDDGNYKCFVTHGANCTVGTDLQTGKELWRLSGLNGPSKFSEKYDNTFRMVASPGITNGSIIVPTCKGGPVLAIRVGDQITGELSESTSALRWVHDSTPDVVCPIVVDGHVYLCQDGRMTILELESGKVLDQGRLHASPYRASPIHVDGHLYYTARDGVISVIKTGPKFELVSENNLGEAQTASPVVSNGVLYLRTYNALYAVK